MDSVFSVILRRFLYMVKYLVIRFSSIGDIVLTSPVVRCLKQQVDDAEVHFLTKPAFASLVSNNPYIDKVLTLKERLSDTISEINAEQYDYIIDLHHNLRTSIIKNRTRILSFSFPKLNFRKWLLVNFKINRLPNIHIVDRYFETVKLFDVQNDKQGLDLFIPPNEEVSLQTLPDFVWHGYVAVVVGAKHVTKQMPADLIARILDALPYSAILLGDQNDRLVAEKIIRSSTNKKLYNACGQYSILQSASLVKQSRVVLTADTGLMHIAAAFRKRIVSVWGNTVPQFGMYPYLPKELYSIHEVNNLPCRPCSKLGYKQCPKKHFRCMKDQQVEQIIEQIRSFYEQSV